MFSADELYKNICIKGTPPSSQTLALLQYHLNNDESLIYVVNSNDEINDQNVVKVLVKEKMKPGNFVEALDFVRSNKSKKQVYHHVGIYAFTNKALLRYVSLKRSKLELERKLEQLRAMEDEMSIHVGYLNSSPLSVDTEQDLIKVKKIMEKNE